MKYILKYKLFENLESKVWYHGTDETFTEFKEPDDMSRPVSKLGIWFTDDMEFSEMFGSKVIKAKLSYSKPCYITTKQWNDIRSEHAKDIYYFSDLREKLIKKGYDAFYIRGENDTLGKLLVTTHDVVAVFYKSQIEIINH